MKAADVFAPGNLFGEADEFIAALLAHGGQGVAILPDGTLWALELMPLAPSAEGVRRAWVLPVSAEAGDTDG